MGVDTRMSESVCLCSSSGLMEIIALCASVVYVVSLLLL
jgi:hypothetical protein